jgi:hypothetical protein
VVISVLDEIKVVADRDEVDVRLEVVVEAVVEDEVRKTIPAARPITMITTITAMIRIVLAATPNHRVTAR